MKSPIRDGTRSKNKPCPQTTAFLGDVAVHANEEFLEPGLPDIVCIESAERPLGSPLPADQDGFQGFESKALTPPVHSVAAG